MTEAVCHGTPPPPHLFESLAPMPRERTGRRKFASWPDISATPGWKVLRSIGLAATVAVMLEPATALAVGGPTAGAVSAQTVKLPSGPGSVRGLADNARVSSFTGQVSYSVPIELPQGVAGMRPHLALVYAGELGNGPLGVGWTLSEAAVRRSLRLGIPAYDGTDELELVGVGAGGQLVRLANGEYRLEGQGHGFVGREVDGGFELLAPDGLTYRFGV